jgi:2-polyprenyl-6-hydroxyphenyl methylase/3-demethylubiquinone-9 3-methyltransferase
MKKVNNHFYDELGELWLSANDHPVALLRAENRLRNPWILSQLQTPCKVLDMGCGAGFLTHDLAMQGHHVTGIDLSEPSLMTAKSLDPTKRVEYLKQDVMRTTFQPESFDVVCAMDLLEHVENPKAVIQEASRLLKPGGLFFFHTFNRNFLSWLIVIKGVEWLVKNTPPAMHVLKFFIKPAELKQMCQSSHLQVEDIRGVQVKFLSKPFFKMALTQVVPPDLEFVFSKSVMTGYSGISRKIR